MKIKHNEFAPWLIITLAVFLLLLCVVLEFILPLRLGVSLPLAVVVLLAGLLPGRYTSFHVAAVCSAIVACGFVIHSVDDWPVAVSSLSFTLSEIWLAAVFCLYWKNRRQSHVELEGQAQAVLETTVDSIITIDHDAIVRSYNSAAATLFGYPADEVIGRNIKMLMPPPYCDEHDQYIASYLRSGAKKIIGIGREVTAQHRNGTLVPVHLAVSEVPNQRLFTGVVRDISELKRVERQLRGEKEKLDQYVNLAPVIFLVLDQAARIVAINHKGCHILGYPESEVLGRNFIDLCIPPRKREESRALFGKILTERVPTEEYRTAITTRHGDERLVSWFGSAMRDEHDMVTGVLCAGSDITDRQQMEQLAMLGELAAHISHEIKNPLAGIQNVMDIFAESLPSSDPRLDLCLEVKNQLKGMDNMVRDLLSFARHAKPQAIIYNLANLVEEIVHIAQRDPLLSNLKITRHVHVSTPEISLDPKMFSQVLINLIQNAGQAIAESGRQDGALDITIERLASTYRITLSDNGPGMAMETLARIFDPFFTTRSRGTGLGLPICRRLVQAHQGSITAHSDPGKGATFIIELPA